MTRIRLTASTPCRGAHRLLACIAAAIAVAMPRAVAAQADALRFPDDEGVHAQAAFEMWSGFAHVRSDRGRGYSILVFFFRGRILGFGLSGVYGAVLDTGTGVFVDDRDLVKPIFGRSRHTPTRLDERFDGSALSRNPATAPYELSLETGRLQLRLTMRATRDPVDLGPIAVGKDRTQRTYVVPRMDVTGRLEGRNAEALTGTGMFQHAWGESPDRSAAQDIIAIHLDDGTDVFVISGSTADSAVVMVATDSTNLVLREGFRLEADTLVTEGLVSYRRQWRLRMGTPALSLRIDPSTVARQVSLLGIPYLIVRCNVRGDGSRGEPMSGVAYMYVRGR